MEGAFIHKHCDHFRLEQKAKSPQNSNLMICLVVHFLFYSNYRLASIWGYLVAPVVVSLIAVRGFDDELINEGCTVWMTRLCSL